ncbi:MAG: leucyl/phenylalanyl-tRNA--protein transferase [Planctomycetes bacterium]|nr:leucyl/phenylalanyl-tRNA--protein transferase [Planctomycetota bacterium]
MDLDWDRSSDLFIPSTARRAKLPAGVGRSPSRFFPPPTATTPDGMLCIGGRLFPEWLLDAYRHGIFPWPMWDIRPMVWWSPDPRAILEFAGFHTSRRLARTLRSGKFEATCNRDFTGVIRGCATANGRIGETWLTPEMIAAYEEMHVIGHAHSVEVWHGGELAGGTYGVSVGGLFAAESMFYRVRDASKVALAHLVAHLRARQFRLLDVQQWTPHTGRLGAIEITRNEYLQRLATVVDLPVTFGNELEGDPRQGHGS